MRQVDRGYWKNVDNQRSFLDKLASKLNITNTTDWNKFSVDELARHGVGSIANYYDGSVRKGTLLNIVDN
jgi:hypothetical protein